MSALQSPPNTGLGPGSPSTSPAPRKRRRDHRSSSSKLAHPAFPPPKFWDELSTVPLTRNAVRELDRRNAELAGDAGSEQDESHHQEAAQYVSRCSDTSLDQIKDLALQGGPDLRDIRGYCIPSPEEEMSASQSSGRGRRTRASQSSSRRRSKSAATTKNTGPYDGAFAQHLMDHNILPINHRYPDRSLPPKPDNLDGIRQALTRRRASLSSSRFSEEGFDKFIDMDSNAASERQVTSHVIPLIQGDVGDTKSVAGEIPFTNLQPLTDGTLVSGNPDLYYGARPEQLHQKVRRELNGYIVPSTQTNRPIIHNFCLAVKGTMGTIEVALRQACYDGAFGARAMHELQSYGMSESEPRYDNKAYTLTSVYQAGVLRIYTSHPIHTPEGEPGFAMNLVKIVALADSSDAFREGVAAFRNGRDWAKEQRDGAIKQANERMPLVSKASTGGISSNDTSADELSLDIRPPVKRSKT